MEGWKEGGREEASHLHKVLGFSSHFAVQHKVAFGIMPPGSQSSSASFL